MVKLGRVLILIAVISLVFPLGCAQEQEPDTENPEDQLVETLQLTDEQLGQLETGTGTLELREDQVDTLSDYVTQLLDDLQPWLDEAEWEEVKGILEEMLAQGEVDLQALVPVAEAIHDSLASEAGDEVEVYTNLVKLPTGSRTPPIEQSQVAEGSGPSTEVILYTPGYRIDGDRYFGTSYASQFARGLGSESVARADPYWGVTGVYTKAVVLAAAEASARQAILIHVPVDGTDISIDARVLYTCGSTTVLPPPFGGTAAWKAIVPPYQHQRPDPSYLVIEPLFDWVDAVKLGLLIVSAGTSGLVHTLIVAAKGLLIMEDFASYLDALQEDGEEEVLGYTAHSLEAGDYVFEIGFRAKTVSVLDAASVFVFGAVDEMRVTMGIPSFTLGITSTDGGRVTEPGEGPFTAWEGEVVGLVAIPDTGYQFVRWTGDVDMIDDVNASSATIAMHSNYLITANFEELPPDQFTLTVSSTGGGSASNP
ncbi:hypothetical protein ACFLW7_05200, partial [Chloroflexota bacterium]